MLLTGGCFVAVMVTVKFLSKELPTIQAAFFRYLFGLIIILPLIGFQFKKKIKNIPIFKHGIRGIIHGFAVVLWFYSVANIPMADVTAINYLTPIFTTIGAILIFKEVITFNRFFALILSFIGALLILKPGFENFSDGKIAQLFSTILYLCKFSGRPGILYLLYKMKRGYFWSILPLLSIVNLLQKSRPACVPIPPKIPIILI